MILAAGAPRSPAILQLSGIGPKGLLSSLGIEVIEDLPGVGYNFHDQSTISSGVSYNYAQYPYPSPDWLNTNKSWSAQELAVYYKTVQDHLPWCTIQARQ